MQEQQPGKNRNLLLFLALSFALLMAWLGLRAYIFPTPPPPDSGEGRAVEQRRGPLPAGVYSVGAAAGLVAVDKPLQLEIVKARRSPEERRLAQQDLYRAAVGAWIQFPISNLHAALKAPEPALPRKLITLGDAEAEGSRKFHLRVVLDSRGAGVRSVTIPRFQAVDGEGRPSWQKDKDGKDTKEPRQLELIPEEATREQPAYLLYHFPTGGEEKPNEAPSTYLGDTTWTVVEPGVAVTTKDGDTVQTVTFQAKVDGFIVQKIFSLKGGDYHLNLDVHVTLDPDAPALEKRPTKFRYQLTGAKGLPLEGKWYTYVFRNALIGRVSGPQGTGAARDLQDLRSLALWEGGNVVSRDPELWIRYAAVANQYFASAIVVSNDNAKKEFLTRARPTVERGVAKGTVNSVSPDRSVIKIKVNDYRTDEEFYVPPGLRNQAAAVGVGDRVALIWTTDSKLRSVVQEVRVGTHADETQPLWESDITVRVFTEPGEVKERDGLTHKYLLYNGPVKPRLLYTVCDESRELSAGLLDHYKELELNSMQDHPSPGFLGGVMGFTKISYLLIHCTNFMHWILSYLTVVLPYGLSIIALTFLVRAVMYPISRKGALMALKMQALTPEVKKIKEKFKGDRQAEQLAIMQLYRNNKVSPLGTCWSVLLQTPIFMGLYFCLQESIQFRAAEFWPTWIVNLAAPDMLFEWGRSIPWLSRDADYGGFLYLGPFFNLLPFLCVALMLLQQKLLMPPPTDEMQEQQQKVMKFMMIIMAVMFYKIVAGLCVYIITSTTWSLVERMFLLPKKKPDIKGADDVNAEPSWWMKALGGQGVGSQTAPPAASTAISEPSTPPLTRKPGRGKKKDRSRQAAKAEPPANGGGAVKGGGWWQSRKEKLIDWWQGVLKEAQKKAR